MGQGNFHGIVWGRLSDCLTAQQSEALLLGRDYDDMRVPEEGSEPIASHFELSVDGLQVRWCHDEGVAAAIGVFVACDRSMADHLKCSEMHTTPLSDAAIGFIYGPNIAVAQSRWDAFRAFCRERADFDPGEGELLLVRDCD